MFQKAWEAAHVPDASALAPGSRQSPETAVHSGTTIRGLRSPRGTRLGYHRRRNRLSPDLSRLAPSSDGGSDPTTPAGEGSLRRGAVPGPRCRPSRAVGGTAADRGGDASGTPGCVDGTRRLRRSPV